MYVHMLSKKFVSGSSPFSDGITKFSSLSAQHDSSAEHDAHATILNVATKDNGITLSSLLYDNLPSLCLNKKVGYSKKDKPSLPSVSACIKLFLQFDSSSSDI